MPMAAQVEEWESVQAELRPILPLHYQELSLHVGQGIPLDPDWDAYAWMDHAGQLLFVALRDGGALVGYFIGIIRPHLHYRTCLTCAMDIYYVHPDARGRFGGLRLMRAVETELRRRGVRNWMNGSKLHRDSGRLFEALGMKMVETYYTKWL